MLILLISIEKLYFGDDNPIYDVITEDMKSAMIHLLNKQSFRYTQPFSFLDKLKGPILPFVVLALWQFLHYVVGHI